MDDDEAPPPPANLHALARELGELTVEIRGIPGERSHVDAASEWAERLYIALLTLIGPPIPGDVFGPFTVD